MIHLDLFSGIGGFALAVDEVWDNTEHIFCEIDPYCQALLKKRFPKARIYGDIRELTADTYRNRLQKQGAEQQTSEDRQLPEIKLLTGGFPCQPFSQAGKRKGTNDDRHLWPEMLRVIHEFKPTWVIAENVRGLLTIEQGVVFQQVCLDLEREGYETQPFIIPAVAVNAPHRRDRVWFVGNNDKYGNERKKQKIQDGKQGAITARDNSNAPDTTDRYAKCVNVEGVREQQDNKKPNGLFNRERQEWKQNWLEVATELCRVDDGLPAGLDGLKLSKSRHRVERLKALGNAIVPQVAVEIMKAIKFAEEVMDL